ncbi:MAG: hypothetical protein ABMA01_13150, partial [Chthoniobacteraceae bacterium]
SEAGLLVHAPLGRSNTASGFIIPRVARLNQRFPRAEPPFRWRSSPCLGISDLRSARVDAGLRVRMKKFRVANFALAGRSSVKA